MIDIPIVFIHFGHAWFLPMTLAHAVKHHNTVYLITDQDISIPGVEVVRSQDYMEGVEEFSKLYKHMSTNSEWVEHLCIVRWKIMLNLLREKGHEAAVYLDSDILLFENLNEFINKHIQDKPIGMLIPEHQPEFRWVASAHTSYMKTEELEKLWDFMKAQYAEKELRKRLRRKHAFHIKNNKPGGICDMTLLYLYSQENAVLNMLEVIEGCTFDDNINASENFLKDEYEMREQDIGLGRKISIKNFQMVDHKPQVKNLVTGELVTFRALHFQGAGGAKELIAKLQEE